MTQLVLEIFSTLEDIILSFADIIIIAVSSIVQLFYTPEGGLTFVGTLLLIGLGMSLVFWAFRFIRNLIRR